MSQFCSDLIQTFLLNGINVLIAPLQTGHKFYFDFCRSLPQVMHKHKWPHGMMIALLGSLRQILHSLSAPSFYPCMSLTSPLRSSGLESPYILLISNGIPAIKTTYLTVLTPVIYFLPLMTKTQ